MATKKTKTLNEAIFAVKQGLTKLKKDVKGYGYNYADLNQHLDVVEPLLQAEGLVLIQPVMTNGQSNIVSSEIRFKEAVGESEVEVLKSQLLLPIMDDMQKLGGAITYARRYTLASLLGMQAEDNDAAPVKTTKRPASKASSF